MTKLLVLFQIILFLKELFLNSYENISVYKDAESANF